MAAVLDGAVTMSSRVERHGTVHGLFTEHRCKVKTSIDIEERTRTRMVHLLNRQLANIFDLMSQTKQAHWNVKGEHFYQLQQLFDDSAEVLEKHVDDIAERATSLGGVAMGTVRTAASASEIPEFPQSFAGLNCV